VQDDGDRAFNCPKSGRITHAFLSCSPKNPFRLRLLHFQKEKAPKKLDDLSILSKSSHQKINTINDYLWLFD